VADSRPSNKPFHVRGHGGGYLTSTLSDVSPSMFMQKKMWFAVPMLFVLFFANVPFAKADFAISSERIDTYSNTTTLFNRTDCNTSEGAKCRFQFFTSPGGVVIRNVEFSFGVQGGSATVKACLYRENYAGNFDLHTQIVCSTSDAVSNTDHKQTFTFTTPYVVNSIEHFSVSMEIQSGGDLLVMGNKYASGAQGCYMKPSAPVACGGLINMYYVVDVDDHIYASGDYQNPFTQNQIGLTDFLASYPDHDTAVGACGTSSFQDYWQCFWSYVQYFLIPTADPIFNSLARPYTALQSRWPFGYILLPLASYEAGLNLHTTTCPFDDLGGGTLLGETVPDIPMCSYLSDVKDAMESNQDTQDMLVIIVYIGFGSLLFFAAKNFLHG